MGGGVGGLAVSPRVAHLYSRHAFLAVAVAGFTPIPYKVFTIAGGIFHAWVPFPTFVLASALSRGARFYLVAWIVRRFGPRAAPWLEKHLGLATLALGAAAVAGFLVLGAGGGDGATGGAVRLRGLLAEATGSDAILRAEAHDALRAIDPDAVRATGFDPARAVEGQPEPRARLEAWVQGRAGPIAPSLDERLFRATNRAGDSAVLDGLTRAIDNDFVLIGVWFVIAVLAAWRGGPRTRETVAGAVVAAALTAGAAVTTKYLVARPRPSGLPEARLCVPRPEPTSYGFPSSHAAVAGAGAAAVAFRAPGPGAALGAVALVIGGSRGYGGVHYPGDVGAGLALGTGIAWALWAAWGWWRRRGPLARPPAPPPPSP